VADLLNGTVITLALSLAVAWVVWQEAARRC
jgi:hypothetical protein